MKRKKPEFYVTYKDFNGCMETFNVMDSVFNHIFNSKGRINKRMFCVIEDNLDFVPVRTKDQLRKFIDSLFIYLYCGKCEWEYIAIDWPYRDTIESSHPVKIDVYTILKPNIQLITDLVWDYIEPKIQKLIKNEQ